MRRWINYLVVLVFIVSLFLGNYIILGLGFFNNESKDVNYQYLEEENRQLKKELDDVLTLNELDSYQNYDYVKSKVLLRDVYNFNETITIKYGKDKNIKKGMAVVGEKGLIGVIEKVNKASSVVRLLTSSKTAVSIKIDDSYGALDGYNAESKTLEASSFTNYDILMKKEEVYTSGLALIPEGIYIGKVENVTEDEVQQWVNIKSDVDFNNIKYVAIIRNIKEV